jgi:hypothetical protein
MGMMSIILAPPTQLWVIGLGIGLMFLSLFLEPEGDHA